MQTAVRERLGDGCLAVGRRRDDRRPRRAARASSSAGAQVGAGAHVGPLVVLGAGRRGRRRRARRALGRAAAAPRSARAARCATAIVAAGARVGDARASSTAARCSARASTSGRTTSSRAGARVFPGVELPDGATQVLQATIEPQQRRSTARRVDARSTRATSSPTSSRFPSTCATRSGRSSPPASSDWDTPGGLIVAGMGGSAIGGDLARAALGDHASRPILSARGYGLPAWTTPDTTVLCASYSGNTEETLACFEAAGALGAQRVVVTTGGKLAELARADGVPVIPVAGGFQPRAAVAYMTVAALEVAAAVRRRPAHARRDRRRRRAPRAARRRVGPRRAGEDS